MTACTNIYNDQYCQLHLGNCWRQATAANLVKNCRKTCVCKCCSSVPPVPTNATHSKTTTAKNARTTGATTTATILYTTTTARQKTAVTNLYSTSAATVLYSTSTEEGKTKTGTKGTFVNYFVKVVVRWLAVAIQALGTCFPALGTVCLVSCAWCWLYFSRAWCRLYVFPRFVQVACFPARGASCTFSRAWYMLYVFPCVVQLVRFPHLLQVVCFPGLSTCCWFPSLCACPGGGTPRKFG